MSFKRDLGMFFVGWWFGSNTWLIHAFYWAVLLVIAAHHFWPR